MQFFNTVRSLAAVCATSIALSASPQSEITSEPFHTRSGPMRETLFTELPPEQTGVTVVNSYDNPRMWTDRYQEMVFGTIGTGIAIADYDKDGRPDIFVSVKTGGSKLYRNLGNWQFEDVAEDAGVTLSSGSWSDRFKSLFGSESSEEGAPWDQGASFVDINNDGWLDLYVTCFDAPNRLYINQGDGTFNEEAEQRGLDIKDSSGVAAFSDYDRDGWLDLYLQTNILDAINEPEGRPDRLLHNNGDGSFTDVTDRSGISGITAGHSATWWDFNQDGWPDLYVANDFSMPDKLYQNSQDGTFRDVLIKTLPRTPYYSMGSDIGDVNNDSRIDLYVADMAPSTHEKDQRGMAISRARELGKGLAEQAPQRMRNALYLNTGIDRMLEAAWMHGLASTDWTWSTRFEDLDNDGFLDLHVTNGMIREYHNADILQKVMGAVSRNAQRIVMRKSPIMSETNLAFRNTNGKGFERIEQKWGLGQRGVSFGAAFGDLDGDGDLDLVFTNYDSTPTILRNDEQTGHRASFALRGTRSNRYGVGATVTIETASGLQTRQLLIARGYLSSSEPTLHFGLGKDETIKRATVQWPSGLEQTFENLPADNRFTITEATSETSPAPTEPASPSMFVEFTEQLGLANTAQTFQPDKTAPQPLAPFSFSRRGPSLAVGDLNGDKRPDILIGATGGQPASLFYQTEDGSFRTSGTTQPISHATAGPMLIEDFDGDGDLDLLVTSSAPASPQAETTATSLFWNKGNGTLQQAAPNTFPATPALCGATCAADFNRDGTIDLFIGSRAQPGNYPLPGRSVLLANREGQFEDATDTLLPNLGKIGLVTGTLWNDVNADGWPDLLVTTEWGQVRCFQNRKGKTFEDVSEALGFAAAGIGLWSCLAQGDFNEDGKPDFIAGNMSLNTPYQASPQTPAVLYYGNFGGRGAAQLIEAFYQNGQLLPTRSLKELSEAIPSLSRRFSSTNAFAASSLEEIFGAPALSQAQKWEATQLRSGTFLSNEDNTYTFTPLSWLTQVAPLQGIAVADFDGDGHQDLAATQNLYDVDPTIGRFDGGLGQLLLGNGRGEFQAIEAAQSGLIIPGDAKYISAADLDGDGKIDIMATRSGSSPVAFRNRTE